MPRSRDTASLPIGFNGHKLHRREQADPWKAQANCAGVDPALFYPEVADRPTAAAARAVCAGCPVRLECLAYALRNGEEYGIWGGTTERDRRLIRRLLRRLPNARGGHAA